VNLETFTNYGPFHENGGCQKRYQFRENCGLQSMVLFSKSPRSFWPLRVFLKMFFIDLCCSSDTQTIRGNSFYFRMPSQGSSPIRSPRRSRPPERSSLDSYLNLYRQSRQEENAIRDREIDQQLLEADELSHIAHFGFKSFCHDDFRN
jgi:hypothetical protein